MRTCSGAAISVGMLESAPYIFMTESAVLLNSQEFKVVFFIGLPCGVFLLLCRRRLHLLHWLDLADVSMQRAATRLPLAEHIETATLDFGEDHTWLLAVRTTVRLFILLLLDDLGLLRAQELACLLGGDVAEGTIVRRVVRATRVIGFVGGVVRNDVLVVVILEQLVLPLLHEIRVVALGADRPRAATCIFLPLVTFF